MPEKAVLCFALTSCMMMAGCADQTAPASSQNSASKTDSSAASSALLSGQANASRIQANGPVERLEMTGEVPVEEGEMIDGGCVIDGIYYFSVLNTRLGERYPTVAQYKYDLVSETLTLLKKRDPEELVRVWDFLEKDGVLYESLIASENGEPITQVLADGQEIWRGAGMRSYEEAPSFTVDQDTLYLLTRELDDSVLTETVYRIDGDQSLHELWSSGENGFGNIECVSDSDDQYGKPVFQTSQDGAKKIVVIRPDGYDSYDFDRSVLRFVPVSDQILMVCRMNDSDEFVDLDTYFRNEYFVLSTQTGEAAQYSCEDTQLGNKIAGAGADQTFLYIDAQSSQPGKAVLQDGTITPELLSEIEPGTANFWRINDSTALVCSTPDGVARSWNSMLYYLVDMN